MPSSQYHRFHLSYSEARPKHRYHAAMPYFICRYAAHYLGVLIRAGLWHAPFLLNQIIVLLEALMAEQFVVGEGITLCRLTNESLWTRNKPRPALPQHPRAAKPSSFLVFTIYHQSVQGFPTSPLSRRHLNGSWLMMENPESDEKGEKY